MCGSMVDIQSAAAEIRREIRKEARNKKEDRKKAQGKNIMSASATQGGHNNERMPFFLSTFFATVCCRFFKRVTDVSRTVTFPGQTLPGQFVQIILNTSECSCSKTRRSDYATNIANISGIRKSNFSDL